MGLNRTQAPEFKAIESVDFIKAKQHNLNNGIPVHLIQAGTQELIRIDWIFGAGTSFASNPLIPSAVNQLLEEGTKSKSAEEIANAIDFYGAFLENEVAHDSASVTLYVLNKHLANVLPLVEEVIKEASFPEFELETYVRNKKQKLAVSHQKVNYLARKKFNQLLFGNDHPYGHFVESEEYDLIKRADLVSFHQKHYHAGNCRMLIAGKVPLFAIDLLDKHFGGNDWLSAEKPQPIMLSNTSVTDKKHLLPKEDALQSAIRLGCKTIGKTHPDIHGLKVLNTLFGGYFGSRLMANIREDKGYTYGIGSAVVSLKQAGYFFVSTEVGAEVCSKALDEIYKEMNLLRVEEVDSEELEVAVNYMLGNFLRSIDGPFQLADKFKSLMEFDLDYDYFDAYLNVLKTIKPADIQQLAQRYLNAEDMIELVVGKR